MAKKRGQGEGSITKMPNGTFQARIEMGRNENGNRIRKARYFKLKKEAQEWLLHIRNDIKNDAYIEPSKMTVAQWLEIWLLEYKKNHIKPKTYLNYHINVEKHIKPLLGKHFLKDLRGDTVQKFINDLSKEKGLGASVVKNIKTILYSALEQACENGLIAKNPASHVKLPRHEKPEIEVLTLEEQQRFIGIAQNRYHGEIFILILATGLRIGEALALTWNDIDFEKNLLRVNKTVCEVRDPDDPNDKWRVIYGSPKTKSSIRTIPLLPDIANMLKLAHQKSGESRLGNEFIFKTRTGNTIRHSSAHRKFKDILKKADITNMHIHCLRHTFATRGLEQGIELKIMQELLGHSSINMTADLYTHVLPDKKYESILKLAGTINF